MTLTEILKRHAQKKPDKIAYRFLANGEDVTLTWTYAELDLQARTVAATLNQISQPGDRIVLLYPPGLAFLATFFACIYSGRLAVPVFPPDLHRLPKSLPRLQTILQDSKPAMIATTLDVLENAKTLRSSLPWIDDIKWLATDHLPTEAARDWHEPTISHGAPAFLQYTSGSTSEPKGILVSHENIYYNQKMIQNSFRTDETSDFVSWLPHYHDMGLIGNLLHSIFLGSTCTFMPPMAFLRNPFRWLAAISKYRAQVSGAPNFAYDLCTRKVSQEQKVQLELSTWQLAFNGAETVKADTLKAFYHSFSSCGFRPNAQFPVYGLAEATLFVSGRTRGQNQRTLILDKSAIEHQGLTQAPAESALAQELVSCGYTHLEQDIRIVDPQTQTGLPDNQVGEIWLKGPHIPNGYWEKPETTVQCFMAYLTGTGDGPYLRTGDLGFLNEGELFVTGRIKDLIKIRGRSLYPQDIETSVEKLRSLHPELRPGCIAAFALQDELEESAGLVLEITPEKNPNYSAHNLGEQIRRTVLQEHNLKIKRISLLMPGQLPKTSSGKIKRHACRELPQNELIHI